MKQTNVVTPELLEEMAGTEEARRERLEEVQDALQAAHNALDEVEFTLRLLDMVGEIPAESYNEAFSLMCKVERFAGAVGANSDE